MPNATSTTKSLSSFSFQLSAFCFLLLASTTTHAQDVTATGTNSPNTLTSPTWNVGGNLTIGDNAVGTLSISGNGSVSNARGTIGLGSNATVTVSGGTWTNSDQLWVGGNFGNGTLVITGGAVSSSSQIIIGGGADSGGIVDVSGGSLGTLGVELQVFSSLFGTGGTLLISGNGSVFSGNSIINGSGTATVSGGTWTNSGDLTIGANASAGTATLAVSGGSVSSNNGVIGSQSGTGNVTVSGGSWTNSGTLTVGFPSHRTPGNGLLTVSGNGSVSATSVVASGLSGTVNLNGGTLQLTGNQTSLFSNFVANSVRLNGTGGTIDTQSFNVATAQGLTGNGSLTKQGNGTLTLTGNNTFTGGTIISVGTLLVNNITGTGLGTGNVSVANGATLGGTGSITGNILINGILSPGASIETLASGTLSFSNNSTYAYEVNSSVATSAGADLQVVTGDLELAALVTLAIDDIATSDTAFDEGTKFALINYNGNWNGGLFTYGTAISDDATFTAGCRGAIKPGQCAIKPGQAKSAPIRPPERSVGGRMGATPQGGGALISRVKNTIASS
jgi:autotransporter-associated beta strand protein/T5SS/PEP-CTERM-associated repeat protein